MILIPDVCGTCGGSNNAINLVYEIYKKIITGWFKRRIL